MIRILLVDDQKTVREYLRAWLEPVANFEVVGTASDGHSAIEQVELLKPDIVLIDMEMPGLNGFEATFMICQKSMGVKVIILSMYNEQEYLTRSIQAGATGYLLKNTPKEELIEAISLVNRGYSHFAPGLVNKIVDFMPGSPTLDVPASKENGHHNLDYSQLSNLNNSSVRHYQYKSQSKPKSKKFYLIIWLLGNLVIWGITVVYLQFKQPSYTSKWAIALPTSNSFTNIDIPGVGEASSENQSPFNTDFSDPRENYKYLVESEEVLKTSASKVNMPKQKFGTPKVEVVENTTLIQLQIQGQTPQIAQAKALAVQSTLEESLDQLRQNEIGSQSKNLEKTLAQTKQKLEIARQKLADFQAKTRLSSGEQLGILIDNIEQLRRQSSEISAQKQKATAHSNQLLSDLGLSASEAADALLLNSDSQFQEYLSNYSQVSTELIELKAKYLANHPSVIAQQAKKDDIETELYRRGESLLGEPFTQANLQALNTNTNNSSVSQRASLFQELITSRAEQKGLENQATELNKQITSLETKVATLTKYGSELEKLQRDVQMLEAVFSSTATRANLSKSQTSGVYPPISLISQPTIIKELTTPNKKFIALGSFLASLLLTTSILSLWWRDRRFHAPLSWESNSNHNNHQLLPNSNSNSNSNSTIQEMSKK
ncbi:MAG: response regulator [Waterburya sp.]